MEERSYPTPHEQFIVVGVVGVDDFALDAADFEPAAVVAADGRGIGGDDGEADDANLYGGAPCERLVDHAVEESLATPSGAEVDADEAGGVSGLDAAIAEEREHARQFIACVGEKEMRRFTLQRCANSPGPYGIGIGGLLSVI